MKKRLRIAIVRASARQLLASEVQQLVLSGKIVLIPAGDDLMWCILYLHQAGRSLADTLDKLIRFWGQPIPVTSSDAAAVYLFRLLEGRVRDRVN